MDRKYEGIPTDQLTYHYVGNQLQYVMDASSNQQGFDDGNSLNNTANPDYSYDPNGNMERDANKAISSISYNHLNLPEIISFANGSRVEYVYDASGIKLEKRYYDALNNKTRKTTYRGALILENDSLQQLNTADGRIRYYYGTSGLDNIEFQYHLRDHLGNNRVTFTASDITLDNVATMEPVNSTGEEMYFMNVGQTRQYLNPDAQHVSLVDGSKGYVGMAFGSEVLPGDRVDLSVKASYYHNATGSTVSNIATTVFQVLSGSTGAVIGDGLINQTEFGQHFTTLGLANTNHSVPDAYVIWMLFDDQLQLS